jgi:diguanylate cyclase (GGDEF)-like protein
MQHREKKDVSESTSSHPKTDDATDSRIRPTASVGHVLIVGRGQFADDVRALFDLAGITGEFTIVSSYLTALAHAQASHRQPEVIIGSVQGLGDLARSTATNLRRLSPKSKLILIASPAERELAKQAVDAGFDMYLTEPLGPDKLKLALLSNLNQPHNEPEVPLGDIDLVQQLLEDQKDISDVAMQILRQQSGIASAKLVREGKLPTNCIAQSVQHGGRTFGLLTADTSIAMEALEAWASWLAHWLSLQTKMQGMWKLAMSDPLTGVWNRRYFDIFLKQLLRRACSERFRVSLMIFDIDDFKQYNDKYGHPAGDEILIQTAQLMKTVMRPHDVIARIGGDEFAVIFWDAQGPRRPNSQHPTEVRSIAQRFQQAIVTHQFSKLHNEAPGTLTISGGISGYPWDGSTAEDLIDKADQMALQSKRQGKNALIFGPGA